MCAKYGTFLCGPIREYVLIELYNSVTLKDRFAKSWYCYFCVVD